MEFLLIIAAALLLIFFFSIFSKFDSILHNLTEVNEKLNSIHDIDEIIREMESIRIELAMISHYFHELYEGFDIEERVEMNRKMKVHNQL